MENLTTIHVKIKQDIAKNLKNLASVKGKSVGELVRNAINACYQADFSALNITHKQALEAYRGGYISIGKLSEIMGMHVLELRNWLNEHDILQNNSYVEEDVKNA